MVLGHFCVYSTTRLSCTVSECWDEIIDNTNTGSQIKKLENRVDCDILSQLSQVHNHNIHYKLTRKLP